LQVNLAIDELLREAEDQRKGYNIKPRQKQQFANLAHKNLPPIPQSAGSRNRATAEYIGDSASSLLLN
jgi:hypothetical protein